MVRDGWTPSAEERAELLRMALQDDDASVIKALIEFGGDPNHDYGGTAPLMMVQSGASARALLNAGANPLVRDRNGGTPLDRAVNYEPNLTEVLLTAGIPPDQPDLYGRTPLLQAACAGNAQVVKLLLARGADPTRHPPGESALECARSMKDYARLYRHLNSTRAFVADFDAVIVLLEQALATRRR